MTFGTYSPKTGRCWDQNILTGACPGIVLVTWAGLDFDFWSLILYHAHIFPKKHSKSAKSNPIFHWKGRGDTALPFIYLDSAMAKYNLQMFLIFSILATFKGKKRIKGDQTQKFGMSPD